MRGCVLGKDTLRLFPNRAKPGAYLGEGPLGHGLQNCIEKWAKLRHAPPPLQVGHQAFKLWDRNHLILGEKWDEIWVKTFFCSSPDFGRKMGRNLSVTISNSDLCSSQIFWSFWPPPLFKILRTLLGQAVYTRCAGPVWWKTCKHNSKRVLCNGVVKQSQTAWFTSTNEQTWLPLTG